MTAPQVDFYLLRDSVPDGRLRAACRLSKKVLDHEMTAYIRTRDAEEARRLDDLMWTFDQGSFLPHRLDTDSGEPAPLLIGVDPPGAGNPDVLINLADDSTEQYAAYERVAEIVDAVESDKQRGRQRYKLYKENGCRLETHHIKP